MKTINLYFKSDFQAILASDAGWAVPFRLKFYTNAPSRPFIACYDGEEYHNCHLQEDGRLCIGFDNHGLGLGELMLQPTFYLNNECYRTGICDEAINPFKPVFVDTDGEEYTLQLSLQGATSLQTIGTLPAFYQKGEKGDKGDKGEQGIQGIQGVKGDKGDKGDRGEQGIQGVKGDTGATGATGAKGEKGDKGDKGDPFRYTDFTPEQLEGLRGPRGYQGETGPQGVQGIQGPKGDKGDKGEKGDSITMFPNVTIFGQPTIQESQISNFSADNYLQFPFVVDFAGRPWQIDCAITTGSNVSQQHNVLDSAFGLAFAFSGGKFVLALSSDGTSWNLGATSGTHTILANTTYYIRISWDGSVYKLAYSTDKETWVDDITVISSASLASKQIIIGKSLDNRYIFNGSINMSEAHLTISGKIVWEGMDDAGLATRMAIDLSNIDEEGKQRVNQIVNDGEVGEKLSELEIKIDKLKLIYDEPYLKGINLPSGTKIYITRQAEEGGADATITLCDASKNIISGTAKYVSADGGTVDYILPEGVKYIRTKPEIDGYISIDGNLLQRIEDCKVLAEKGFGEVVLISYVASYRPPTIQEGEYYFNISTQKLYIYKDNKSQVVEFNNATIYIYDGKLCKWDNGFVPYADNSRIDKVYAELYGQDYILKDGDYFIRHDFIAGTKYVFHKKETGGNCTITFWNAGKQSSISSPVYMDTSESSIELIAPQGALYLKCNPVGGGLVECSLSSEITNIVPDIKRLNDKEMFMPMVKFDYDHNVYTASDIIDFTEMDSTGTYYKAMDNIYAKFDSLVDNDFVKKTDVVNLLGMSYPLYARLGGVAQEGYDALPSYKTYMYEISKSNVSVNSDNQKRLKVFIIGATHGNEVASPYNLYLFAKRLVEADDANYFKLLSVCDFYIVPCLNGYGMLKMTRYNANGVNINRNMPIAKWQKQGNPYDANYTGESAGSEFESRLVISFLKNIGVDIVIDAHNYSNEAHRQFYCNVLNQDLLKLTYQSLSDCSFSFVKNLPHYFGNKFHLFIDEGSGYQGAPASTPDNRKGTINLWAGENEYVSATIEISACINYLNGMIANAQDMYGVDTFKCGEYTLRNLVMRFVEYTMMKRRY